MYPRPRPPQTSTACATWPTGNRNVSRRYAYNKGASPPRLAMQGTIAFIVALAVSTVLVLAYTPTPRTVAEFRPAMVRAAVEVFVLAVTIMTASRYRVPG